MRAEHVQTPVALLSVCNEGIYPLRGLSPASLLSLTVSESRSPGSTWSS